jgi:hypothetical protein
MTLTLKMATAVFAEMLEFNIRCGSNLKADLINLLYMTPVLDSQMAPCIGELVPCIPHKVNTQDSEFKSYENNSFSHC